MTEQEARRILGISAETDMQEIKKRYRRLMLQAHPDAADPSGGSCGSHTLRAQEINLAYSLLKQGGSRDASASQERPAAEKGSSAFRKKSRAAWNAPVNPQAYTEREILHYAENSEGTVLGNFCVARGKYLWTTEEDFPLFLLSISQCAKGLLDTLENSFYGQEGSSAFSPSPARRALRSQTLAELVYLLAQQFIDSSALLRELSRKQRSDKNGASIFYFSAMLETEAGAPAPEEGALLSPAGLRRHRLYLKDPSGQLLGYLSFPDDRLYYVIIPLFEQRRVQVRIQVQESPGPQSQAGAKSSGAEKKKGAGRYRRLHLWVKLLPEIGNGRPESLNLQIEQLLTRYRQAL
ncbi:MAG: J domain-containing protein [Candidatus Merdisoma sp.]|jgi:curved DNA-binding protein CbpA